MADQKPTPIEWFPVPSTQFILPSHYSPQDLDRLFNDHDGEDVQHKECIEFSLVDQDAIENCKTTMLNKEMNEYLSTNDILAAGIFDGTGADQMNLSMNYRSEDRYSSEDCSHRSWNHLYILHIMFCSPSVEQSSLRCKHGR